ncbi:MAG: hypothetical protein U5N27_15165 [Rhizobium sp.]|nr:hypothetical protein [Rhizobium sp.]
MIASASAVLVVEATWACSAVPDVPFIVMVPPLMRAVAVPDPLVKA